MKKTVKLIVNFLLIAVIAAALCVGNWLLFGNEQEVSSLLSPAIVDTETLELSSESGQAFSRRIMTEGAVMLKNNGTLPLSYEKVRKVNVFGWRSIDWIYGSEGYNASGGVSPENGDLDDNVDIYKALNKYGIQYNQALYDMYYDYLEPDHQSEDLRGTHISNLIYLREPKIDDKKYYSESLLSDAREWSDTAIVVIGRMAGEGMNADPAKQKKKGAGVADDGGRHYLELSSEEEALLTYCGANYENVIVLMNVANPFEMGFLETIPGIDACLYIGFTGTRAAQAIPGLLYGDVSPSGRTVDTFAYDLFTNPANVWLGGMTYTDDSRTYSDYIENIYVGYKWYETADAEGVWQDYTRDIPGENGAAGTRATGYDAVVQFPFGYGLSYNDYSWEVGEITFDDGTEGGAVAAAENAAFTDKTEITIPVTVTNNGTVPGRDVVEVYVEAPYYGHEEGAEGAIEKSAVTLAGFGKTNELAPGASETIEIEIDPYDFASYDCYDRNGNDFKGWELEQGDYTFSLRTDSHTVKEVTYGGTERAGDFVYKVEKDITMRNDPDSGLEVTNKFTGADAVDTTPVDGTEKDSAYDPGIEWFTRTDFADPAAFADMFATRAITPSAKIDTYDAARANAWDNATGTDAFGAPSPKEKPTWGADNNMMLAEDGKITDLGRELGAEYDNPRWEQVLDQVTFAEAVDVISNYYGSDAINSVGKPRLVDYDGPSQIKGFTSAPRGTGYPTMVVIAGTWNPKLAYEFGKAYGDDMKGVGVMGLWGWAMDCHRGAFFGRNHESPSEDAFLAGTIISNAVRGLGTRGRYCFIKHFALYSYSGEVANGSNDNIWLTEQALRETYLRSFRMAIVEGGALGVMTTYQGIGAEHAETTEALITGVLRNEWGFNGAVTTDAIGGKNYWCESLLRCGGDLGMSSGLNNISGITYSEQGSTARLQHRMRDAVHHILYLWLHADYNEQQYLLHPDAGDSYLSSTSINGWEWWKPLAISLDVTVGVLLVMWAGLVLVFTFMKKGGGHAEVARQSASLGGEDGKKEDDDEIIR